MPRGFHSLDLGNPPMGGGKQRPGKRWFILGLGLFGLLIVSGMVVLNPFSSFQERKPLLSVALSEKNRPSILITEKEPEEPAKVLPPLSRESEKPMVSSESLETKKDEPLLRPIKKEEKLKISKPVQGFPVKKPSLSLRRRLLLNHRKRRSHQRRRVL